MAIQSTTHYNHCAIQETQAYMNKTKQTRQGAWISWESTELRTSYSIRFTAFQLKAKQLKLGFHGENQHFLGIHVNMRDGAILWSPEQPTTFVTDQAFSLLDWNETDIFKVTFQQSTDTKPMILVYKNGVDIGVRVDGSTLVAHALHPTVALKYSKLPVTATLDQVTFF